LPAIPLTLSLSLKGRGDAVDRLVRIAPLPSRERGWGEGRSDGCFQLHLFLSSIFSTKRWKR
jgi:hypothetical protein